MASESAFPAKCRHSTGKVAVFTTVKKSKGTLRGDARWRQVLVRTQGEPYTGFGQVCDAPHTLPIFCQIAAARRTPKRLRGSCVCRLRRGRRPALVRRS